MIYGFCKLYADLVTEDGTVCIAYLSWLDVLGHTRLYGGLELYGPNGQREVLRARTAVLHPELDCLNNRLMIALDVPGGPFVLEYEDLSDTYAPAAPARPDLTWAVKIPRAAARASWAQNSERPVLRGTGYADWVELRRLTRQLQLQALQWGRLHLPDRSLVFNAIRFRGGTEWKQTILVPQDGVPSATSAFRTQWQHGYLRLVAAPGSATETVYTLHPQRILHSGPAIDAVRFPSRLERWVLSGAIEL